MMLARLDWEQEAAPILEQMRLRSRDATAPEAQILDRKPDSDDIFEEVMDAYHETSTSRFIGMVAGPIPQAEVDRWCDRRGLDDENYRVYSDAIRYVDNVLIRRAARKRSP